MVVPDLSDAYVWPSQIDGVELGCRAHRVSGGARVAIVGGGVAGLTAALELIGLGVEVVIIEDRDVKTLASWVAAGLIEPVGGTRDEAGIARELALFQQSMLVWRSLAASGSPLISTRRVLTVCSKPRAPLSWANTVEDFRTVPSTELPRGYRDGEGASFVTYVVETRSWLETVRSALSRAGVKFVRHHLESLDDVMKVVGAVDGIVNASGLGAAKLAGDPELFRGDGHVVRVAPIRGVTDVFMDETRDLAAMRTDPFRTEMIYVIPRYEDIVVGGTMRTHPEVDKMPEPIDGMAEHLLSVAAGVVPALARASIIEYVVGSRPRRRSGVRVELDLSHAVPVVHCYGQGGSGWTLGPGIAQETVSLLGAATWAQVAA